MVSYTFDSQGKRIRKYVTVYSAVDTDTRYVYSGSQVVAEYDYDATIGVEDYVLARKFVYGSGIDQPICTINIDSVGAETLYFYHYDGLGSVAAL